MGSVGADLVQSASPVLVITLAVARSICSPSPYTVHWLAATPKCALHVIVVIWAAIPIVGSTVGVFVGSASPVLVITLAVARSIGSPGSITVHRLCATTRRARLVIVGIRTSVPVVSGIRADLVLSAPLVLMRSTVVMTASIAAPASNTVDRLAATTCSTLQVVVGVGASITTVSSACAVLIASAPLILVSYAVVVA